MANDKATTRKTQLVTLPQELFDNVASRLSARELKMMRFVSREANQKVFDTYKNVCFGNTRTIIPCNEISLLQAIGAASHPIFGSMIGKVRIYVNNGAHGDGEGFHRERSYLMSLLAKFFTKLEKNEPRDIAIELCYLPRYSDRSYHMSWVLDSCRHHDHPTCGCSSETLLDISIATYGSNLRMRELTLNEDEGVTLQAIEGDLDTQERIQMRYLKRLTLNTWRSSTKTFENLVFYLKNAESLEYLSINYDFHYQYYGGCEHRKYEEHPRRDGLLDLLICKKHTCGLDSCYQDYERKVWWEELREFRLIGFTFTLKSLMEFIGRCPKLKTIELEYCVLQGFESSDKGVQRELRRLTGVDDIKVYYTGGDDDTDEEDGADADGI